MDCSSWNVLFLLGNFKDLETQNEFYQAESARFTKMKIAGENASKQQLGQCLFVSCMALNRILPSEKVICVALYPAL